MSKEALPIGKTHTEIDARLAIINEARKNDKLDPPFDPKELIGEYPSTEVPGILQIPEEKKNLIETFKEFARKNDKRLVKIAVITAVGVGLTTIIGVGSYAALKYFIDKNPEADITDK